MSAKFSPIPFTICIPQKNLDELHALVKLSPLPKPFYEGAVSTYGITSNWMKSAKEHWLTSFNWRDFEAKLNKYPNFTVELTHNSQWQKLHYVHVRSSNAHATPLLLAHGWPGCFVEFLDMIPLLTDAFHIVIPSIPGFTFSGPPPLDRDFTLEDVAALYNQLMVGLGYNEYIAQGGDMGSSISRLLAVKYKECVGVHFNLIFLHPRPELPLNTLTPAELASVQRFLVWKETGNSYALEQGTRPSTVAHALAASPLALMAWIGEKLFPLAKSPHLGLEFVVNMVSLWWLTETAPTSLYLYRDVFVGSGPEKWNKMLEGEPLYIPNETPIGYSGFMKELSVLPRSWAERTGRLVFYRRHETDGHFAAVEKPEELAADLREFAGIVWKGRVERGKL